MIMMTPTLFLIGPAASGKDSLAHWLHTRFGYTVEHLMTPLADLLATPPAHALLEALNRPVEGRSRRLWQNLADAWRAENARVFVNALLTRTRASDAPLVIADGRLPEEILALRDAWPHLRVIQCMTPPDVREARLQRRDGLHDQHLQHHTEAAATDPALQALVDWIWINDDRPLADTLVSAEAWMILGCPSLRETEVSPWA